MRCPHRRRRQTRHAARRRKRADNFPTGLESRRLRVTFQRPLPFGVTLAAAACFAALASTAVRADNSAPAIVAFDKMFAGVNDYTAILHVHEAKGTQTQDRVYQYQ